MALELHSVKRETVQNSFPKVQFQENLRSFSMGDLSVFRLGLPMEVNNGQAGNGHHVPVVKFVAIMAIVVNVTELSLVPRQFVMIFQVKRSRRRKH